MKVIGISYGHNATVCLAEDGRIIFVQSEERINRIKNSTGFPVETLKYIDENICNLDDVQQIVLFQSSIYGYKFMKRANFESVQYGGYLDSSRETSNNLLVFRSFDLVWNAEDKIRRIIDRVKRSAINDEFREYIWKVLGVKAPIEFLAHHDSHAYSTLPFIDKDEDWLIVTMDAAGDFLSSTVSEYRGGRICKISSVPHTHSIGTLFSIVTTILGMKAGEHEYKVMGLAPYADKAYGEKLAEKLRKLVHVTDEGQIEISRTPATIKRLLEEIFENQRFDNISYAIQIVTEEIVISYIKYWIKKTRIHNVALSGGVFMNVKANMKVLKLDCVNKLRVVPSSGDESTAIGAAIAPFYKNGTKICTLDHLYLGSSFTDEEVLKSIKKTKFNSEYIEDIEDRVAELLSQGEIVARFKGRMEFGARALGNRSILANPSNFATVDEINRLIKIRDFWMPFCPSILEEDKNNYVFEYAIKGNLEFMAIAVEGKTAALRNVVAASHPRDNTIRPQFVSKMVNKEYHYLISKFKSLTGIGAVLNTSFNLHGEPNVCSPSDALNTFGKSGLRFLALNNFLITK